MESELGVILSFPQSHSQIFRESFPYYLSIGMSAEQFWDGDALLVAAYRKADKLRFQRKNEEMWLQGMYFYDSVSTAMSNAFARKGAAPILYPDKPYALSRTEQEQRTEEQLAQEAENERLIAMLEDSKFRRAAKRSLKARQKI